MSYWISFLLFIGVFESNDYFGYHFHMILYNNLLKYNKNIIPALFFIKTEKCLFFFKQDLLSDNGNFSFTIYRNRQMSLPKFPPFCCQFPTKEWSSLMPNPRRWSVTMKSATSSVPVRMHRAWTSLLTSPATTKRPNTIVTCLAAGQQ